MKVYGVVGANYGDEGKGMVSAHIRHQSDPCATLTVLTNGGAQRGHTVDAADGRRFVFHHLGAAHPDEVINTYCPAQFVINPLVLAQDLRDARASWTKAGITVWINPACPVTTPYDMMANQIEELCAKDKWGSTGMGVWHTRNRSSYVGLSAGKLFGELSARPDALKDVLRRIRTYWLGWLERGTRRRIPAEYMELFETDSLMTNWMEDVRALRGAVRIGSPLQPCLFDTVIFENAQGLMLSADLGNHTTSSLTGSTLIGMTAVLERLCDPKDIKLCYVSRTYATRHGEGELPLECPQELLHTEMADRTNGWNQWQGNLRYGMLDYDALVSRVLADIDKTGMSLDKATLVMTHANEVPNRYRGTLVAVEVDNPHMLDDCGITG